jgi:hypothetical protein
MLIGEASNTAETAESLLSGVHLGATPGQQSQRRCCSESGWQLGGRLDNFGIGRKRLRRGSGRRRNSVGLNASSLIALRRLTLQSIQHEELKSSAAELLTVIYL